MIKIPNTQTLRCRIFGGRILMHADTTVDPLHPLTRKMKKLSSSRKKTDDTHEQMGDIEWRAGIYHDEKLGPYIPSANVLRCIQAGGTATKMGAAIKRSVFSLEDKIKLIYDGPSGLEKLAADPRFRDRRSVAVQRARVMRTRPVFHDWSLEFDLIFSPGKLDGTELAGILATAGAMIGLGDYRPTFGRFAVDHEKTGLVS